MKKKFPDWLDAVMLVSGMVFIDLGVFLIYPPAGFITLGGCLVIMAILVAKKNAG